VAQAGPEEVFRCLAAVAAMDGEIAEEERQALEAARARLGIDAADASRILTEAACGNAGPIPIPTGSAGLMDFLQQVVPVIAADGRIDPAERRMLENLRTKLGIAPAAFESLLARQVPREQLRPARPPGARGRTILIVAIVAVAGCFNLFFFVAGRAPRGGSASTPPVFSGPMAAQEELRKEIEGLKGRGKFGKMPEPEELGVEVRPGVTLYQIDNNTGYPLSVYFEGPETFKASLPAGDRQEVEMRSGSYTIYASVTASHVSAFRGQKNLKGSYHSSFYIRSSGGGGDPQPLGPCPGNHQRVRTVP
jgi:hypothetical protein